MELPVELKNSPKQIIPIQINRTRGTIAVIFRHTRRSGGRTTAIPQARPVSARCWPLTQTQSRRARLRGVVMARRWAVTLTATTTNARTPSGGRRHRTNPLFCIRRLRRRGGRHTHRTGRESRGRGPTPATLSTQMGPLSTRRVPAALL